MNERRNKLISGYNPFIADNALLNSSYAEPFPPEEDIEKNEKGSIEEIDQIRRNYQNKKYAESFDPPIPLSDLCVIIKDRWDEETIRISCCHKCCPKCCLL